MIVKLLTAHHLEFLSLKGGCRGLSESTHVGNHMPPLIYSNALQNTFIMETNHKDTGQTAPNVF